jgi:hypothetical protein
MRDMGLVGDRRRGSRRAGRWPRCSPEVEFAASLGVWRRDRRMVRSGGQVRAGTGRRGQDIAWTNAPDAEKAARFASAEAVRWVEWGMRSYHNFALGLALLLFAAANLAYSVDCPTDRLPDRPLRPGLSGAGLGSRLRRLLADEHDPDSGGLGPQHRVDDLVRRRRLAPARLRAIGRTTQAVTATHRAA